MQLIDFALLNNVQVAMDASTLRHLLSAPWSQRAQNYACKLKVISRVFSGFQFYFLNNVLYISLN